MWILRSVGSIAALLAAFSIAGCSGKSFSAEEFVDEANENGASLELGPPLSTNQPGKEVYELRLASPLGIEPADGGDRAHSAGSLAVYDDDGKAEDGVMECEATADLLCYQAGNVVVVLEGAPNAAGPAELAAAISKMAE